MQLLSKGFYIRPNEEQRQAIPKAIRLPKAIPKTIPKVIPKAIPKATPKAIRPNPAHWEILCDYGGIYADICGAGVHSRFSRSTSGLEWLSVVSVKKFKDSELNMPLGTTSQTVDCRHRQGNWLHNIKKQTGRKALILMQKTQSHRASMCACPNEDSWLERMGEKRPCSQNG